VFVYYIVLERSKCDEIIFGLEFILTVNSSWLHYPVSWWTKHTRIYYFFHSRHQQRFRPQINRNIHGLC